MTELLYFASDAESWPRCSLGKCAELPLGLSFNFVDAALAPFPDRLRTVFRLRRRLFRRKPTPTALAVVRLRHRTRHLSPIGILCDGNLQSDASDGGFLSGQSFDGVHGGSLDLVDRILAPPLLFPGPE